MSLTTFVLLYISFPNLLFSFRTSVIRFVFIPLLLCFMYCLPIYLLPEMSPNAMAFFSSMMIYSLLKTCEFCFAVYDDVSVRATRICFLIYFFIGTSVKFDAKYVQVRWNGLKRFLIGMFHIAVSIALVIAAKRTVMFWNHHEYLWNLYFFILFYCNASGFWNGIVCGTVMMIWGDGLFIDDMWQNLFSIYQVRQLWKRWNIGVHQMLVRLVYVPLEATNSNKQLRTMMVFLVSAILHEYPTWCVHHHIRFNMVYFFMVQAIAILIQDAIPNKVPKFVHLLYTMTVVVCTLPLFARDFGKTPEQLFAK